MTNHTKQNDDRYMNRQLLERLGWTEEFEVKLQELSSLLATDTHVGRVISGQRDLFLVSDGGKEWFCSPSGTLFRAAATDFPVTGDWVLTRDKVVTGVIPRQNLLSRGEAGARSTQSKTAQRKQSIGANLDTVFIVCGLDRDFNLRRLERYLSLVHGCGLSPVIVLTKADLLETPEEYRLEVESIAFGVPIFLTSIVQRRGKEDLEQFLGRGQTVALIGSSGAGKSTLVNLLYGDALQATANVSDHVGKGRHTTTTRELIRMPQGGLLMDNPGIREIAFDGNSHGVEDTFADITELAEGCRFGDCSHQREPGCAVLEAIKNGNLTRERLESYHKMKLEMHYLAERSRKSADRIEKERWQSIARRQKDLKKRNKQ